MVILDTNIIIDHIRLQQSRHSLLSALFSSELHNTIGLSVLSLQELYERKSTRHIRQEQVLLQILSSLTILPYTVGIAKAAGIIARDLDRPIDFVDAAIAATAIIQKGMLYTLNTKDFEGIKDLRLYSLNAGK